MALGSQEIELLLSFSFLLSLKSNEFAAGCGSGEIEASSCPVGSSSSPLQLSRKAINSCHGLTSKETVG